MEIINIKTNYKCSYDASCMLFLEKLAFFLISSDIKKANSKA